MNWTRLIVRGVVGFAAIFLLGYIVPGFSAFTYTHLLFVSLLVAILSTMAENVFLTDTPLKKSTLLFVISAVTIYFYSLLFIKVRMPLVSTILIAAIIGVADYFYQKAVTEEPEEKAEESTENPGG